MTERKAESKRLVPGPLSSASIVSDPKEKADPTLSEYLKVLRKRTHDALATEIRKQKEIHDIPDDNEISKMQIAELMNVCRSIGAEVPFSLLGLQIIMDVPKTIDSEWKKRNFQKQLAEYEKEIKALEIKNGI